MKTFDPQSWYWIVGGNETRVFFSAKAGYVQASNVAFVEWLADGTLPTRIATELELWDVLIQQAPTIAAQVPAALDRMKDLAVANIENGTSLGVLFKVLRNINNRVRVLEGQQPLTVEQTRAALRTLL